MLQPDSKWNIITWTLMTAVTLALGLASGQRSAPQAVPKGDGKATEDSDSASKQPESVTVDVSTVNQVEEVQKLSQLGEANPTLVVRSQNSAPQSSALSLASSLSVPVSPALSALSLSPPFPSPPSSVLGTRLSSVELAEMTDEEILQAMEGGRLNQYELEDRLEDTARAVVIRRKHLSSGISHAFDINAIPFENYDYDQVKGKCCENVIGYVPIPVGVVGPVLMNGKLCKVPMATTEGCLVASTQRGMKAISSSGGASAVVTDNGMTRGPLVRMPDVKRATAVKAYIESTSGFAKVQATFNSTSNYARLRTCKVTLAGRNVYIRFKAFTGDAMGMNMISKGVEKVLGMLKEEFEDLEVVAISGNFCTDKKPSAINWIEGRGRSVTADVVIKGDIVRSVLKTTVAALVDVNTNKNLIGSAMAGSIGGFNAHAANILTAIYLATGQDPAQNVESSNCITIMESTNDGKDLYMSVTMPSIEIGTIGGGTGLPAQSACLEMMACKGSSKEAGPGANGDHFAQLIATSVMAGELSLISAISAGHLVNSHMQFNRGKAAPAIPSSNSQVEPGMCLAKL